MTGNLRIIKRVDQAPPINVDTSCISKPVERVLFTPSQIKYALHIRELRIKNRKAAEERIAKEQCRI